MSSSDANANASAGPLMEWKAKYGQDIVAFKVHGAKMFLGTYHGVPGACDARVCCATCVCDVCATCVRVRRVGDVRVCARAGSPFAEIIFLCFPQ